MDFQGGGFDTKKFMDDLTKKDCDMRLYFIPMTTSIFRPEMIVKKKNLIVVDSYMRYYR